MRDVVLAPGLWMPGLAMTWLAARLRRSGFVTHVFSYRGRSALEEDIEAFGRFVRQRLGDRPAHFVGHSLGGVLVLHALNRQRDIGVASAVLLGSPVRGSLSGRRLGRARIGRWMMGASTVLWSEREACWNRDAPLGVVAGTAPFGLGHLIGRLQDPNDGVVLVKETHVDGMGQQVLVRCGHSFLIFSTEVEALVERFLKNGKFD